MYCCVFRVFDVMCLGVKTNHIYHGYMVYVWDSYSGGVIPLFCQPMEYIGEYPWIFHGICGVLMIYTS